MRIWLTCITFAFFGLAHINQSGNVKKDAEIRWLQSGPRVDGPGEPGSRPGSPGGPGSRPARGSVTPDTNYLDTDYIYEDGPRGRGEHDEVRRGPDEEELFDNEDVTGVTPGEHGVVDQEFDASHGGVYTKGFVTMRDIVRRFINATGEQMEVLLTLPPFVFEQLSSADPLSLIVCRRPNQVPVNWQMCATPTGKEMPIRGRCQYGAEWDPDLASCVVISRVKGFTSCPPGYKISRAPRSIKGGACRLANPSTPTPVCDEPYFLSEIGACEAEQVVARGYIGCSPSEEVDESGAFCLRASQVSKVVECPEGNNLQPVLNTDGSGKCELTVTLPGKWIGYPVCPEGSEDVTDYVNSDSEGLPAVVCRMEITYPARSKCPEGSIPYNEHVYRNNNFPPVITQAALGHPDRTCVAVRELPLQPACPVAGQLAFVTARRRDSAYLNSTYTWGHSGDSMGMDSLPPFLDRNGYPSGTTEALMAPNPGTFTGEGAERFISPAQWEQLGQINWYNLLPAVTRPSRNRQFNTPNRDTDLIYELSSSHPENTTNNEPSLSSSDPMVQPEIEVVVACVEVLEAKPYLVCPNGDRLTDRMTCRSKKNAQFITSCPPGYVLDRAALSATPVNKPSPMCVGKLPVRTDFYCEDEGFIPDTVNAVCAEADLQPVAWSPPRRTVEVLFTGYLAALLAALGSDPYPFAKLLRTARFI